MQYNNNKNYIFEIQYTYYELIKKEKCVNITDYLDFEKNIINESVVYKFNKNKSYKYIESNEFMYVNCVNKNNFDKIIVISDVHGNFGKLYTVQIQMYNLGYMSIDFVQNKRIALVCLGDMVNRGENSLYCLFIQIQINQSNRNNCFQIGGNHENMQGEYIDIINNRL